MRIKFETLLYSIKIMVYTTNCVEFDFMYNQLFSIVVKGKGLWYIKKKRKIVSINGKFRHVASFLKVWGGGRLIQKNLIKQKKNFFNHEIPREGGEGVSWSQKGYSMILHFIYVNLREKNLREKVLRAWNYR